jgi:hypothetical protein
LYSAKKYVTATEQGVKKLTAGAPSSGKMHLARHALVISCTAADEFTISE